MNTPSSVIPLTIAEVSRYERFRSAELASNAAKAPDLDEMIDVVLGERERIERSVRAAEAAYGGVFDEREIRRCAVLQRAAEFLGLVAQHKDEIGPVLKGQPPKRRRSA